VNPSSVAAIGKSEARSCITRGWTGQAVAGVLRRVDDSEPEAEFQETVNKSKAMLKAVALAETSTKR
jgi:anthranilate/para-aminobenzoate synthase component I